MYGPCIDRAILVCVLVIVPAIGPGPSWAQSGNGQDTNDPVVTYRQAVERGEEKFAAGDYAGARAELERAYAIHPEPNLLFTIASAYRREGNRSGAIEYYGRFIAAAPDDHPRQDLAAETLQSLLTASPPGPGKVADAPVLAEGESRTATTPALDPLVDVPAASGNTDTPEGGTGSARIVSYSLVGLGTASILGGGGYFGWRAWSQWGKVGQPCRDGTGECSDDERAKGSDARSNATTATIFVAAGLTATAAGVISIWLTRGSSSTSSNKPDERVQLVPVLGPDGVGLVLRGPLF